MKRYIFFILLISVFLITGADEIPNSLPDTKEVDTIIENSLLVKLVTMLGFGGFCGFVTGFALKKIARIFAVILGVIFIVIQFFVFQGWIDVHWENIANSTQLFTGEGMTIFLKKLLSMLVNNLPFGGSFIFGLLLGVKKR